MAKTQKEAVANHLKTYKCLTSMQAIELYGITRLSEYIMELRREGWNITSERCKGKNRFGHTSSWCNYQLQD